MRHIQAWIVNDRIAMEGAENCRRNRNPPFTEGSIKSLHDLFREALGLYRLRTADRREAIRDEWC